MTDEDERTRAGVAAWQRAGAALTEARWRELAPLTDAGALVIADDLLRLAATLRQRLFARLRG